VQLHLQSDLPFIRVFKVLKDSLCLEEICKSNKENNVYRISIIKRVQQHVGDKVLLNRGTEKNMNLHTSVHWISCRSMINGTVRLRVNAVEDSYKIKRIIPYHAAPDPDLG
jgi:hypothetical protein